MKRKKTAIEIQFHISLKNDRLISFQGYYL